MRYNVLINSYLPSLTKTEKKVAEYVLNNADKVIYQTLQGLASEVEVGEATVLRFCNKIGCEKFANLKLMIAKESDLKKSQNTSSVIGYTNTKLQEVLENSYLIIDDACLGKAITLIDKAERIYFFGVGSSGLSAQIAEVSFNRMGVYGFAVIDSHFQAIYASNMNKNDLVIAYSISGETKDIYDALKIAKNSKAKLIVITNHIESPIAKLSNVILLSAAQEHLLNGGSLSGILSQLFVTDCLKNKYIAKYNDKISAMSENVASNIVAKTIK